MVYLNGTGQEVGALSSSSPRDLRSKRAMFVGANRPDVRRYTPNTEAMVEVDGTHHTIHFQEEVTVRSKALN